MLTLSLSTVSSIQLTKLLLRFPQRLAFMPSPKSKRTLAPTVLNAVCLHGCVPAQPKVRTSSEESVAGEEERLRKPAGLQAPSPLIRTSSETRVRPTFHPRSSRNSGAFTYHYAQENSFPRSVNDILSLLCDPDPATFPVQDSDRAAELVPPELPPKGLRRRQPIAKVKNILVTPSLGFKSCVCCVGQR